MRILTAVLATLILLLSAAAHAAPHVSPRHLMILREGMDTVWGSYVFAIVNDTEAPAAVKTEVVLPKETADWAPQEGVDAESVKLAADGHGLLIEKEFAPGTHVITIGFKIPASLGKADVTLKPAATIEDLTVLRPKASKAVLAADWLKPVDGGASPDPDYDAFSATGPLAAGAERHISVTGVPEGRARYWMLGGSVAALLVLGALGLAIMTRPRLSGEGAESVLVG